MHQAKHSMWISSLDFGSACRHNNYNKQFDVFVGFYPLLPPRSIQPFQTHDVIHENAPKKETEPGLDVKMKMWGKNRN